MNIAVNILRRSVAVLVCPQALAAVNVNGRPAARVNFGPFGKSNAEFNVYSN